MLRDLEAASLVPFAKLGLRTGQLIVCLTLASLGWTQSVDAKPIYTEFDPSGSATTQPISINAGVITGFYLGSADSLYHGFVRAADGTITSFDPSGSVNTFCLSINRGGAITGYYEDSGGVYHGFIRAAGGTITAFDPSGSSLTESY